MARQKLTPKQALFVQEYLVDLNATRAAIRAGYSKKTACRIGGELLTKTCVAESIQKAQEERSKRVELSQDKVLEELARIAFSDPRAVVTWSEHGVVIKDSTTLTDDEAATVSEVSRTETKDGGTTRIKQYDKLKALELLGKHLGIFTPKQDISEPTSITVTFANPVI